LDDLFASERTRAKQAERNTMLEKLGVKDLKELEGLVKAQKTAEEAQKTDLDKANETIETLKTQTETLAQQNRLMLIKSEMERAARDMKFRDPEDAWTMLDLKKVEIDEDGKVSGVKEQLEDLKKRKPYLIDATGSAPDTNARGGSTEGGQGKDTDREDNLRRRYRIGRTP
jgi:hypothetical protein